MPFINFPDNPSIGDSFYVGIYKYIWTGDAWDREIVSIAELTLGIKSDIVGSAPEDLDTLEELAAALADDADFSVAVLAGLAELPDKLSKSDGGTVAGPVVLQDSTGDTILETTSDRLDVRKESYFWDPITVMDPFQDQATLSITSSGVEVLYPTKFSASNPMGPFFEVDTSGGTVTYQGSNIVRETDLEPKANKTLTIGQRNDNYTLVFEDAATVLTVDSTSTRTVTIPTEASVPFLIGAEIAIVRLNTGVVSIAPAAGVTLNSIDNKRNIKGRYGSAVILKTGTNNWVLIGSLE
jgi:hypothetical protein